MKKLVHLLIVAILFSWSATLMAQCPPPDNSAGVNEFTTQTEIDNLIIDYPNCTELSVYVNIYDEENTTDPITNLNGLANLERIDGGLKIYNTTQLTDLTGLNGLTEVVRFTTIRDNTGLESLNGLQSLTTLNANASSVVYLMVRNNSVLTDISALQNISSMNGGDIKIQGNAILTNLDGLENIVATTIDKLDIEDNPNLSLCIYENLCSFISSGGDAEISGNAPGCADLAEVTTNCQIAYPNCPEAGVTLTTQAEVDQFLIDYPTCAVIPGLLNINDAGTDPIVNLNGLQNIQTVNGLSVQNTTLTDFSGLDALETISGNVGINNISLADVSFLAGFTTIGGDLTFLGNAALTDLTALNSLEEIDGKLEFINNDALTTLSGLDNILANTITSLTILDNNNLSVCNMDAICIYLANGFPATIILNGTGCATAAEIEANCDLEECPSTDITLLTQAELDYFALQYPNCTEINGNVDIGDLSNDITDLQPLQNITTINGYLSIKNTELTNFNGLNNLESVNGSWLSISRNDNITNMQGFDNLTTVSGLLIVVLNDNLETFTGMESLTTLNNLDVLQNPSLLNLDGLNNIGDLVSTTADASISIRNNESLQNIDALSGVTFANRIVSIQNNPVLEDISGLSNLTQIGDMNYIPHLRIQDNHALTTLNLESLETVYGKLDIFSNNGLINLDGLSSLHTVWGLTIQGNNSLENIEGLSNLTNVVMPGFEVQDFNITLNPVLTSISGLENITKIGDLEIGGNSLLASYEGLNNLEKIGLGLVLWGYCPLITNMNGFESLTQIGVEPHQNPIPFIIWDHAALANVEALSNLISLNSGDLLFAGNPQLTSLSGLDNVAPTSIAYIELLESENLSYCEVASVCDFIATAPASQINIGNNTTGCNTVTEVEDACEALVGVEDVTMKNSITLHPNPMQETLTVTTANGIVVEALNLYDTTGKLIISVSGAQQQINVANLSSGIYFIKIETNRGLYQQKLVK